jgi:hypothetical protein
MGEEGPLGLPRGPGGVEEQGDVIPVTLLHQLLEQIGTLLRHLPAQAHDLRQGHQHRIAIIAHPLGVIPEDPLDLGATVRTLSTSSWVSQTTKRASLWSTI